MAEQKPYRAVVEQWQGRPAIRIPPALVKTMGLKIGQKITLSLGEERPLGGTRRSRYKSADLLKNCRGRHVDHWNVPVGNELI